MRIIFLASMYDYGDPARGYSVEHDNFYDTLVEAGHDVTYFDYPSVAREHGAERMNRMLLERVRADRPDLVFAFLTLDGLDRRIVREISESGDTVTVNWFSDDHVQFERFTRFWAPCFNWSVTTAASAMPKYALAGHQNVILSQWACNPRKYRCIELPLLYDVSFVGMAHGFRRGLVEHLRASGLNVQAFGQGWERGRISEEEMVRVFNQSRINLNFCESPITLADARRTRPSRVVELARSAARRIPLARRAKRAIEAARRQRVTTPDPATVSVPTIDALEADRARYVQQIKGRNFEVPACGGFLLTGIAENLADYYEIGREVVAFKRFDELAGLIHRYLRDEDDRREIAAQGLARTQRDHTYAKRFAEIFRRAGLASDRAGPTIFGR